MPPAHGPPLELGNVLYKGWVECIRGYGGFWEVRESLVCVKIARGRAVLPGLIMCDIESYYLKYKVQKYPYL